MSGSNTRRRQRRLTITWVSSLLLGLFLGLLIQGWSFGLPAGLEIALRLGVVVALLAIQVYYWRTLDELARAIQMRAFFWSGLTVWGLFLLVVLIAPAFPAEAARVTDMGAVAGASFIVVAHAALFFVLWGWAWMKPR